MSDPIRQLVEDASSGDSAAVDELLERHLPALHAYVRLHAGAAIAARESCADLVQSVCREVLADLPAFEYRGEAAFKKWLFTQALHKIVDRNRYLRRDKRDVGREVPLGGQSGSSDEAQSLCDAYGAFCTPSRELIAREETERIERAFAQLPEAQRQAITLSRLVGLSYKEIGEETGKSEVAVRGLIARGLAQLAKLLRQ